jgi:hypothetical protein
MMKLTYEFVKNIPDRLEYGKIYISIEYTVAIHKCACGCGKEVVMPLSPTDWKLIYDGKTVSFYPSIGNWSFACRSHYWIKNNQVEWEPDLYANKAGKVKKKGYYKNKWNSRSIFNLFKKKKN